MKHKKFGFLHLMCGKHGGKGNRKIGVEISYRNAEESYLFGFTARLIFFFLGFAIEIAKKQEESNESSVSQETSDNDSV